ncbi:hypothetical protein M407DRAFT_246121, partial [Tulasnella calospora MUT 4182]
MKNFPLFALLLGRRKASASATRYKELVIVVTKSLILLASSFVHMGTSSPLSKMVQLM